MDEKFITAVIPAYNFNKVGFLIKSIDSVLNQKYNNFDVCVITEGDKLTNHVKSTYKDSECVSIIQMQNNTGGISAARNEGIKHAEGEIIAYLDSDAVADENWLKELNKVYVENKNIVAVGGKSEPNWISKQPWYLPDEFLWLVGVTHKGHPPHDSIIRSAFGCNMSFRKNIFSEIGYFDDSLGKNHGFNLQGEEPDIGIRINKQYDTGTYYTDKAVVMHSIEEYQTSIKWLVKRAYFQGLTKYIIKNKYENLELSTENNYLNYLLLNRIPHYIKCMLFNFKFKIPAQSIFWILFFTFFVGIGYIRGHINYS